MKKIKLLGLIAIAGILILNVMIVGNTNGSGFTLTSLVNNALAQYNNEIDEFTITCSSGGSGVCYEDDYWDWEKCSETKYERDCDCGATGDPDDCCEVSYACK